jgi:hypothetical protein
MSKLRKPIEVETLDVTANVGIYFWRRSDAITRITGPDGDEWRTHMYRHIKTREDVLRHWAHNAVANGVTDVSDLDGWADVRRGTVTFLVDT